jgi:hypothetical protein
LTCFIKSSSFFISCSTFCNPKQKTLQNNTSVHHFPTWIWMFTENLTLLSMAKSLPFFWIMITHHKSKLISHTSIFYLVIYNYKFWFISLIAIKCRNHATNQICYLKGLHLFTVWSNTGKKPHKIRTIYKRITVWLQPDLSSNVNQL